MKVILTDRVKTLGNVGEIVNVSQGYARNYLIPNKFAILADGSNSKQMEDHQKMLSKKVDEQKKEAQELAEKLSKVHMKLIKKVGGSGALFGTVTSFELSKLLYAQDLAVEKRQITIETPIKSIGTYDIDAELFKDVKVQFKVTVEADPVQMEEIRKKQEAEAAFKLEREKREAEAKAAEEAKEATEGEEADS